MDGGIDKCGSQGFNFGDREGGDTVICIPED